MLENLTPVEDNEPTLHENLALKETIHLSYLSCEKHGEADTLIIYHICQICVGAQVVVVDCPNSDILIILLRNIYYIDDLNASLKFWIHWGVEKHLRLININDLY